MPLTTDDRLAIMDLFARYNHAIDGGRPDEWVQTFTPDGAIETVLGTFQGPEQLHQFAAEPPEQARNARHWINSLIIEGDGDSATVTSYVHLQGIGRDARILGTAIYEDTLRKLDGAWKIQRRCVRSDP